MKVIRNPQRFQRTMAIVRRKGMTVGFVPTMGALHEGHLSLVRKARKENDRVAVSLFVNPMQFGPKEDFKKYPRTLAQDLNFLKRMKTDFVFCPSAEAMYPKSFSSTVETGISESLRGKESAFAGLAGRLCGRSRPGHFRGVVTVVSKLFLLAQPDCVYFGAKDYQQAMIIRRLIEDLNFNITFRLLPTYREKDGLAMSSRNRYLSPQEREAARVIPQTLKWMKGELLKDRRSWKSVHAEALRRLRARVTRVDYLEGADPETLQSLHAFASRMIVLTACYVGKTRLIDNILIQSKGR